jgi:hypothetical protein
MRLIPLHRRFGVEVCDIDLRTLTSTKGYLEIRAAVEEHSLFRKQWLDDAATVHVVLLANMNVMGNGRDTSGRVCCIIAGCAHRCAIIRV